MLKGLACLLIGLLGLATVPVAWYQWIGFEADQAIMWHQLAEAIRIEKTVPPSILVPSVLGVCWLALWVVLARRVVVGASGRTRSGGRDSAGLHGSARWATRREIERAGLLRDAGVFVGGIARRGIGNISRGQRIHGLRHDGPEHVLAFAPTRSGKGVSLVVPTLLTWEHGVFVLDIKGENHALSAGYRASLGHRVVRFDPASETGCTRFNPLAEVRRGAAHEIADCQNIAEILAAKEEGARGDPFFDESGKQWLATVILHCVNRFPILEKRLADVFQFLSGLTDTSARPEAGRGETEEDPFEALLAQMIDFRHGADAVDREVRRGASAMREMTPKTRSSVHATAVVKLGLWADPVVAHNTAASEFRIADIMNGAVPMALYLVVAPNNIARLRPLTRIFITQVLNRLTAEMTFAAGRQIQSHTHRLLLLLDEFASQGTLKVLEDALAFMAGYGIKAFLIAQDINQIKKLYGEKESIIANCQVRVSFAPNTPETARYLSQLAGDTTVVQEKQSYTRKHHGALAPMDVTRSLAETKRALLTPDECMAMGLPYTDKKGKVIPGDVLTFVGGQRPIRGTQFLFFKDKMLQERSAMEPPETDVLNENLVIPDKERTKIRPEKPEEAVMNRKNTFLTQVDKISALARSGEENEKAARTKSQKILTFGEISERGDSDPSVYDAFTDQLASQDASAAEAHLKAGRPIVYLDEAIGPDSIREWPDGRREFVQLHENGQVTVLGSVGTQ